MATPGLLQIVNSDPPDLVERVRRFAAEGADLSAMTAYGESALRAASRNGRFQVVRTLLDLGADPLQLEWTESFFEVAFGTNESLEKSVAKHNDLRQRDYWNRTPWLLAVHAGDVEKASLLLRLGASRVARGRCGRPALSFAAENDDVAMTEWLISEATTSMPRTISGPRR